MKENKTRCFGSAPGKEFYAEYHDTEWGIPVYDDRRLFEMLILEGAQAGLNWETVLKKREEYRKVFYNFDPVKVAKMTDEELNALLQNQGIIRNRLKIYAARQNALVFLQIQKEFGSFANYVWKFVDAKPIVTRRKSIKEIPSSSPISDTLSKDLKKRGMTFVGSTILYAFMQAVGLVDDHLVDCWCANRKPSVFRFAKALASQRKLIHHWLEQPHLKEWIHGTGLQNTLNGLENFFVKESDTTYWVGYHHNTPFAFLITSSEGADAITLDVFICEVNYLGKGLAVPMIQEFLRSQFSHMQRVLIDPEATNTRAIHVYQKVGFKIIGEFIASWHPVPHYQMELCIKDLKNTVD